MRFNWNQCVHTAHSSCRLNNSLALESMLRFFALQSSRLIDLYLVLFRRWRHIHQLLLCTLVRYSNQWKIYHDLNGAFEANCLFMNSARNRCSWKFHFIDMIIDLKRKEEHSKYWMACWLCWCVSTPRMRAYASPLHCFDNAEFISRYGAPSVVSPNTKHDFMAATWY